MRKFIRRLRNDDGMTTAEYAVGTAAAVAFATVLLKVVTSETVTAALSSVISRALG
jgi:Flp pilus assembly pilin Flp